MSTTESEAAWASLYAEYLSWRERAEAAERERDEARVIARDAAEMALAAQEENRRLRDALLIAEPWVWDRAQIDPMAEADWRRISELRAALAATEDSDA